MKRRTLAGMTAAATTMAMIPAAALAATSADDHKVALTSSGVVTTTATGRVVVHGAAAASSSMLLTLQLPMRNQALADVMLARGTTLTPAQYRSYFAPTQAQVTRVTAWAKKNGMAVSSTSRDSGSITVQAPVNRVNRAFAVSVKRASAGKVSGLAVDRAPQVPASLGLSGVAGLNTLHRMQTNHRSMGLKRSTLAVSSPASKRAPVTTHTSAAAAAGSQKCSSYWGENLAPTAKKWTNESNYLCGYSPQQLTRMYGTTGTKQAPAIGILLWGGDTNMLKLTNDYMTAAGYPKLSSYTATIAKPSVNMNQCDPNGVKAEHAMDVQSSHAIAPSAPIYYYGAADCGDVALTKSLSAMVNGRKVQSISMSFGSTTDAGMTAADKAAWDRPFQLAGLTGISVFASTGDWGNNSTQNGGVKGVGHPASSAYATAVGGTAVGLDSKGGQPVVAGWENRFYTQPSLSSTAGIKDVTATLPPASGGGGGVSASFAQPTWQKGVVKGSTTKRVLPDISALADPYTAYTVRYTDYSTGTARPVYSSIGGTSLASPVIAAVVSVAKAQNGRKIGLASPFLYKLRGTAAIKDVNFAGKAGIYAPAGDYNLVGLDAKPEDLVSGAGWDNVTGLGTPTAAFLSAFGK